MKRCVVCIKDNVVGLYNTPLVFENEDIAFVSIRRWTRDAWMKDEISRDQLMEQDLVLIGQFDTETGALLSFDPEDYEVYPMIKFIEGTGEDEIQN